MSPSPTNKRRMMDKLSTGRAPEDGMRAPTSALPQRLQGELASEGKRGAEAEETERSEMRILPLLRIIPSAIPPPLYYGMLIPHLECCTLVHLELAGRPSTRRQILADPQFSKNIRRHVEPRCVRAQVVKVGVRIITRARALLSACMACAGRRSRSRSARRRAARPWRC